MSRESGLEAGFSRVKLKPTVIIAPELRGRRDFVVVREPDHTDEDYRSRWELPALVLDSTEEG